MFGWRSNRWLVRGLALVAGLTLMSCGGPGVNVRAMIDEFSLYERDVKALEPEAVAAKTLLAAQAHRDAALPFADKGGRAPAAEMDLALADVRLALAQARVDRAQARGRECWEPVERAWESWQATLLMLDQVERVAARTAPDVLRDLARQTPGGAAVRADWLAHPPEQWTRMFADQLTFARHAGVSAADLESRFSREMTAATGGKAGEADRARHLHVALTTMQELEARTNEQVLVDDCARADSAAALLCDARDKALRATIELERGLKDNLRADLETARAEARDRQTELYDALHKLEGRFATITRNARGTIVSLADILFDFNKATLKRDVEFSLVKIATILDQFPEMKIQIEGHTDNVGTAAYNQDLSERRAQSVRDFLVSQGVTAERMTVAGYGLTRPVADNATEAGRQKNRRVDLVIPDRP